MTFEEEHENDTKKKPPAIGIDIGTTYSCLAVWQNGSLEVIANEHGNHSTPSYVAITPKGPLIGEAAKALISDRNLPEEAIANIIYDAKRLIGRKFDHSIRKDTKQLPFDVNNDEFKNPLIQVKVNDEKQNYKPVDITAMILTKLKKDAEDYFGMTVTDAVITVPASFDDAQRQATTDAGTIVGLNVLQIIAEPIAAAIAYRMEKTEDEKNILVLDLGGGTFDVSILTVKNGAYVVRFTQSNNAKDVDSRILNYFVQEIKKKHKINLADNAKAIRRLRAECEQVKIVLSTKNYKTIEVEALFDGKTKTKSSKKVVLTRAKFEEFCKDLFDSTLNLVKRTLRNARMDKTDIHEVVLVGGLSCIPRLRNLFSDYFYNRELKMSINPSKVVAYGAAIQAAILNGYRAEMDHLVLLDVFPLTIGIQSLDGRMEPIIARNTTLPVIETRLFSTSIKNQTRLIVQLFEGEQPLTKDNKLFGRFILKGIPKAEPDRPQIEVTFHVNADGIFQFTAVEKNSQINIQIEMVTKYRQHLFRKSKLIVAEPFRNKVSSSGPKLIESGNKELNIKKAGPEIIKNENKKQNNQVKEFNCKVDKVSSSEPELIENENKNPIFEVKEINCEVDKVIPSEQELIENENKERNIEKEKPELIKNKNQELEHKIVNKQGENQNFPIFPVININNFWLNDATNVLVSASNQNHTTGNITFSNTETSANEMHRKTIKVIE